VWVSTRAEGIFLQATISEELIRRRKNLLTHTINRGESSFPSRSPGKFSARNLTTAGDVSLSNVLGDEFSVNLDPQKLLVNSL
jgi:hypothetical protein